jgi:hypothetical protein
MPDEIDDMLQSEGIFQQRETIRYDSGEKRSGPPLEDSVLDWLEECGDRQHRYAVQEIRMLRAELAALKANDPLNDAVEEACGELPSGWMVLISLERGGGWVDLIYPDGRMHQVHEDETSVADLVRKAIRKAKEAR